MLHLKSGDLSLAPDVRRCGSAPDKSDRLKLEFSNYDPVTGRRRVP